MKAIDAKDSQIKHIEMKRMSLPDQSSFKQPVEMSGYPDLINLSKHES